MTRFEPQAGWPGVAAVRPAQGLRARGVLPGGVLMLALLVAGCGTPDPERVAKEKAAAESIERAASRLYKRPYELIWESLMAAIADRRLTVVQADAAGGVIELRHGLTTTSPGERVDIRVTRTVDQAVRVEIRSRPLIGLSLAPDWQRLLFGDLEQRIAPRRAP